MNWPCSSISFQSLVVQPKADRIQADSKCHLDRQPFIAETFPWNSTQKVRCAVSTNKSELARSEFLGTFCLEETCSDVVGLLANEHFEGVRSLANGVTRTRAAAQPGKADTYIQGATHAFRAQLSDHEFNFSSETGRSIGSVGIDGITLHLY